MSMAVFNTINTASSPIADNGPGIEKKQFEKIFQIFQTFPSSRYFTGSGIGLTMAKKIIEVYNGNIWVESKVGKGSSFVFTLLKQIVRKDGNRQNS